MLNLIRLFSILLCIFILLSFSEENLKKGFDIRIKVVGRVHEEKPKLEPPERLRVEEEGVLDLSGKLLEPPGKMEFEEIEEIEAEGFLGCGEPEDRTNYRYGVIEFRDGNIKKAKYYLENVISMNSPFSGMAKYILGIIEFNEKKEERALVYFKDSCNTPHLYRKSACEAYYALSFRTRNKPVETDKELWKQVYEIYSTGESSVPSCELVIFGRYCNYIIRFLEGEIDEEYIHSTKVRKAVLLIRNNEIDKATALLEEEIKPLKPYRDIALYYISLAFIKKGEKEKAKRYISLLETLNPDYAANLYSLLSRDDLIYSRLAYAITGSKEFLIKSGSIAYNRSDYKSAYANFVQAGDYEKALYSAIRMDDYKKALKVLKRWKRKNVEYYRWLLEVLYWLGEDRKLRKVLSRIKNRHPGLYSEYMGWYHFKKGNWKKAYRYFKDPYYKAIALFNMGEYDKVMDILKDQNDRRARILKAKSAVSMGKGNLARKFLINDTDEEIYLRGLSYFIENRHSEAVSQFQRIDERSPLKPRALLKEADAYYNLGNISKAKEIYTRVMKDYPDSEESMSATLALIQLELQKPEGNLKELILTFVNRYPDSPLVNDLYYQLGEIYIREAEYAKAKEVFKKLEDSEYSEKAKLRLAQLEENEDRKISMLKSIIEKASDEEVRAEARNTLMEIFKARGDITNFARLLSEGDTEDRKEAIKAYLSVGEGERAVQLFNSIVNEGYIDEDLRKVAIDLYSVTNNERYLSYAKESEDSEIKARAYYLAGIHYKNGGDKKKALEEFVTVTILTPDQQPYYNRSILESVDILISMKARKDASCLLEKLDPETLSEEERGRYKYFKDKLPPCEVK